MADGVEPDGVEPDGAEPDGAEPGGAEAGGPERVGWVLPLALLAPVVLLAGYACAPWVARRGYDPIRQTVSTLAGRAAAHPWVMVTVLLVMGAIYLAIAAGLTGAPRLARVGLGVGGAMVVVAALAPQPAEGSSVVHMTAATVAWLAFVLWPLALVVSPEVPAGLRRSSVVATGVLALALLWFAIQLWSDGAVLGVAERVLLLAQTIWPIRVAIALRPHSGQEPG